MATSEDINLAIDTLSTECAAAALGANRDTARACSGSSRVLKGGAARMLPTPAIVATPLMGTAVGH